MDGGTAEPELAYLDTLGLVMMDGSIFHSAPVTENLTKPGRSKTPSDVLYKSFRNYLKKCNAVNMANMLSVQLSAMEMNVEAGFVSRSALVYAPGCDPLKPDAQFISIENLMIAARESIKLYQETYEGHEARAFQNRLKNAIDDANNNLNFLQPTPCAYDFGR